MFHCNLSNDILLTNFVNFLRHSFVVCFCLLASFLFLISQLSACLFLDLVIWNYTTHGLLFEYLKVIPIYISYIQKNFDTTPYSGPHAIKEIIHTIFPYFLLFGYVIYRSGYNPWYVINYLIVDCPCIFLQMKKYFLIDYTLQEH